ncbi:hypothetical protein HHE02_02720 [Helicobacter heilmannii]|uniref:Uncharacterized protein n=1 Tax=Helicobacter heilmannii TaxID=35817 RepID=A0A0K2XW50_HELHE|nr:hypothetical protein [Helicobacter heilmannii]CCM10845.1 hypothetical protein BN341_11280 [Helicobacter heilmannii ASB1.4]CRF46604.1 hypothetical protein HHE014_16190 [Helicobacter heilmannii]CRF46989.1 hypothetical protein HHE02_02720 [Helicobacter heilmannii]CRF49744.1 hypothetical protein HHE03_14100 [Helicobacter heilmannii]CRF51721.1 hypothetical protein HHE06_16190 [Helicobacter heilmannii]
MIPICTEKVFKNEFSSQERHLKYPYIFNKQDQEDYLKEIKKYLKGYLPKPKESKEDDNNKDNAWNA